MSIFSSLGSNYDFKFVLRSILAQDKKSYVANLKAFLEEKYKGQAVLVYKGREALTLALNILNLPKESCVAINGFTCYAVYKAIEAAGRTSICLDLDGKNSDLNYSPETLEKKLAESKNIKVVVIQNTLGYPCDIERIEKICEEKNLVLIEDLAHSVGTKYLDGREAGTVGDLVILSFSQDKMIDAVSGGALIIRNTKIRRLAETNKQFNNLTKRQQSIDRLYPLFTFLIRKTYSLGFGRLLHFFLKAFNLLSKPMSEDFYKTFSLPNWYCYLILAAFDDLSNNLTHRKIVANIYKNNLNKKVLWGNIVKNISNSSNLRFPIFVENRKNLINYLKKKKIYVSDIWYDSVSQDCKNSQIISHKILNLPTNKNISEKSALKIAERINAWLKSQ